MSVYQRRISVHIAKLSAKTAHGLSILPTNGDGQHICGGNSSNTANEMKQAAMKVPQTIIVVGINSKDLDTKSGTPSGIAFVIFFFLQKLYNSTDCRTCYHTCK